MSLLTCAKPSRGSRATGSLLDENGHAALPDLLLDRLPALPEIEIAPDLRSTEINSLGPQRERVVYGPTHQRPSDLLLPELRLDPDSRDPRGILRKIFQIRRDHRSGAEKRFAVVSHQSERDRLRIHILLQPTGDVIDQETAILPPCPPDAINNRVKKRRLLPQIGNSALQP